MRMHPVLLLAVGLTLAASEITSGLELYVMEVKK